MFSEILTSENKQVIVGQDVKAVTEQMGAVEDFEHADSGENAAQQAIAGNLTGRRLFRDTDDYLVGGVCAGIANYFDINPVWVRLTFAALCGSRWERPYYLRYIMDSSTKGPYPRGQNGHEGRETKPAGV